MGLADAIIHRHWRELARVGHWDTNMFRDPFVVTSWAEKFSIGAICGRQVGEAMAQLHLTACLALFSRHGCDLIPFLSEEFSCIPCQYSRANGEASKAWSTL